MESIASSRLRRYSIPRSGHSYVPRPCYQNGPAVEHQDDQGAGPVRFVVTHAVHECAIGGFVDRQAWNDVGITVRPERVQRERPNGDFLRKLALVLAEP